ncbi:hypothetical protein GDO86_015920 [Hymenochirus boettgeri]|uniref:Uncharacterized protein n=1 Tax=Hymenochirus boettgeri TaxID=247094 RepID=A0A8T2JZU4_9PIPI|nr:hypothetical protein GDO86_015920 [Hymenochirus boettgeri]
MAPGPAYGRREEEEEPGPRFPHYSMLRVPAAQSRYPRPVSVPGPVCQSQRRHHHLRHVFSSPPSASHPNGHTHTSSKSAFRRLREILILL